MINIIYSNKEYLSELKKEFNAQIILTNYLFSTCNFCNSLGIDRSHTFSSLEVADMVQV